MGLQKPLLGSGAGSRRVGAREFHWVFWLGRQEGKLESRGWACFEGISAGFGVDSELRQGEEC